MIDSKASDANSARIFLISFEAVESRFNQGLQLNGARMTLACDACRSTSGQG
jgi:hypothetical protein